MPDPLVGLLALAIGLAAVCGLHRIMVPREQWLMVTLLAALLFVMLSMLGRTQTDLTWFQLVRWSLFAATLGAFVRFRWHHRFT